MDCFQLSHGISVEKNLLNDCCLVRNANYDGRPFIINLDENNTVDWKKVFELKRSLKEEKKSQEKFCKGCRALIEEYNFDNDDDFISFINFNHWNICNSKCIYCSSDYNGGDKYFNVLPMIKDLIAYNNGKCLRNFGEVTFQGGEPTLLPEFEDILELFFQQKINVRIHSSGIKFSNAIEKALQAGLVSVTISPDSAVKETYEKIKRVTCFDKVWDNLKRYASAQKNKDSVKAKFIIIPGINDAVYEIDEFLNKVQESGIKHVIWEIEGEYCARNQYNLPHVCMLIDYAVWQTNNYNLSYEYYDGAMYAVKNTKREPLKIENKEDFIKIYAIEQEKFKHLNINYSCKNNE